jgi:hypothetical protein
MKSIAWLAVTAMMFGSLALAQEQKPVPKPAAQEAAKPAEAPKSAETAKPVEAPKPAEAAKPAETAKRVAQAKKPAGAKKAQRAERRTEDARHCLGRPSNTEIIKCAEAYL